MRKPTDAEIESMLVSIIGDGFNRSLGALEGAGAIDTKKLRNKYKGVGSEYYDLVSEQMVLTARWCVPGLRRLFED